MNYVYLIVAYICIAIAMFAVSAFAKYKWASLFIGIGMVILTVILLFIRPVTMTGYFDKWYNIVFWTSFSICLVSIGIWAFRPDIYQTLGIGAFAGFIAGTVLFIAVIVYSEFPLLPGADIRVVMGTAIYSATGLGIIVGKTASHKKHGYCIPFFEDCSQYECKSIKNCKKTEN